MNLELIKKKIQLYVNENDNRKMVKYLRIPLPSDNMPYSREHNAYKDCVRWYAKVAGDRISFAAYTKEGMGGIGELPEPLNSNSRYEWEDIKNRESIKVLIPNIPEVLLNNGESFFVINTVDDYSVTLYNSYKGYNADKLLRIIESDPRFKLTSDSIKKNNIFSLSSTVFSDIYVDLTEEIPSDWVEFNSIDELISDVVNWLDSTDGIDRGLDVNLDAYEFNGLKVTKFGFFDQATNKLSNISNSLNYNVTTGSFADNKLVLNVNGSDDSRFVIITDSDLNGRKLKLVNGSDLIGNDYTLEGINSYKAIDIRPYFKGDARFPEISISASIDRTKVPNSSNASTRLNEFKTIKGVKRNVINIRPEDSQYSIAYDKPEANDLDSSLEIELSKLAGYDFDIIKMEAVNSNSQKVYVDLIGLDGSILVSFNDVTALNRIKFDNYLSNIGKVRITPVEYSIKWLELASINISIKYKKKL